jgi:hypothetical protein
MRHARRRVGGGLDPGSRLAAHCATRRSCRGLTRYDREPGGERQPARKHGNDHEMRATAGPRIGAAGSRTDRSLVPYGCQGAVSVPPRHRVSATPAGCTLERSREELGQLSIRRKLKIVAVSTASLLTASWDHGAADGICRSGGFPRMDLRRFRPETISTVQERIPGCIRH